MLAEPVVSATTSPAPITPGATSTATVTPTTTVDALKILRHVAPLPVTQTEPCPDIGAREN
ncbi:MAG: hypothetical protein AAB092_01765 [Chloroflexota bacterium]